MNVPGCFLEISKSMFVERFGNIGPACCKAFLETAKCMPNLPFNLFFSPKLKEECSRVAGQVPPTNT